MLKSEIRRKSACLVLLALILSHASGQDSLPYPQIKTLLPSDLILKQLHEDLQNFHILDQGGKQLPTPGIYQYISTEGDDLFSLAARFNLPYETLATLNRIPSSSSLGSSTLILVPNQPGIFIHGEPENELESFINTWRTAEISSLNAVELNIFTLTGREKLIFLPGERFHSLERAFFLGILFRNPIPTGRLTSRFGVRTSPITGLCHFHNGIDLAADSGTPVISAREGTVLETGEDRIYGKYILIGHPGGWETFYAHLKKCNVELNQSVTSSMIIGEVGDTGQTTGPHLHFELRRNGGAVNPETLLPGIKG